MLRLIVDSLRYVYCQLHLHIQFIGSRLLILHRRRKRGGGGGGGGGRGGNNLRGGGPTYPLECTKLKGKIIINVTLI